MKSPRYIPIITILLCLMVASPVAYAQFDSTFEELDKALEEIGEDEDEKGIKWVKDGAGKIDVLRRKMVAKSLEKKAQRFIEKNKKIEARELYERAISHHRWLGDSLGVARVYTSLAELENKLNNIERSKVYLDAADIASGLVLPVEDEYTFVEMDGPSAMPESVSIIPATRPAELEDGDKLPVISSQADIVREARRKQIAKTPEYQREMKKLKARLIAARQARKDDSLVQAIVIESNLQHIESLEQDKKIRGLELERKRNQMIGLAIGLGLLAIMAILLWRLLTNRRKSHNQIQTAYQDLETAHTQLKDTQTQLVQAEKMASLGQLTAGIAHEINNPVNYISGSIPPLRRDVEGLFELLERYDHIARDPELKSRFESVEAFKEDLDLEYTKEEIEMLLNGMMDGTSRTAEIVAGLLDFSRIEETEKKSFDIHSGLDSTLNLLSSHLQSEIEIVRGYDPTMPTIMGFPGKLNQVFMNLLSNAIHAIEKQANSPEHAKGTLHIFTEYIPTEKQARIVIRDSGDGISEEILPRIFEPFFTTKDVGEGTGLGLSISYGIIADHGGTIEARNHAEGGAEFVVELSA
ncbi:MAG: sensor histidine kinase [Bacteroidia bacterium]